MLHFFVILIFLSFYAVPLSATPKEIAKLVDTMRSLTSFRADISIEVKESIVSGILSYQENKANLKLHSGHIIATNGIYMIGYNPNSGVAGKQLVHESPAGGLGWLLGTSFGYEMSSYGAHGKAVSPSARIQEVRLEWDENYYLRTLSILRKDSKHWVHLRLSNIRNLTSFSPAIFSYRPPTGSRTVEHALNR